MSIEKLKRVLWRLRHKYPTGEKIPLLALKHAIMREIGTSPMCYKQNKRALKTLAWIKHRNYDRWYFTLTDQDLTDNA